MIEFTIGHYYLFKRPKINSSLEWLLFFWSFVLLQTRTFKGHKTIYYQENPWMRFHYYFECFQQSIYYYFSFCFFLERHRSGPLSWIYHIKCIGASEWRNENKRIQYTTQSHHRHRHRHRYTQFSASVKLFLWVVLLCCCACLYADENASIYITVNYRFIRQ